MNATGTALQDNIKREDPVDLTNIETPSQVNKNHNSCNWYVHEITMTMTMGQTPTSPFPPPPITHMLCMFIMHVRLECLLQWSSLRDRHSVEIVLEKSYYKKINFFLISLKKVHMVYQLFVMNHFKPKDPNFDSLYFVFHICDIFSSGNLFFNPKVTPSWNFGSSHHHLVENVLIFTMKGLKVYYSNC